ncbi:MAG: OmpA family protein [Aureispira sp.]
MLKSVLLLFALSIATLLTAQRSNYAVEVAAFAEPVTNGHFKDIKGVYETLDVNYIYRYYVDAASRSDAEDKQKMVVQAGFVNARVIDFKALQAQCNATCQYVAPKATGNAIQPFVPKEEVAIVSTNLRCIFFDFDRYYLRSDAKEELDRLAQFMRQDPSCSVDVNGHTDARGSQEYNTRLAKKRTSAAKKYLIKSGIASSRITEKTYGENDPIALNEFADGKDATTGRQYNRRVAFTIRDSQGKVTSVVNEIRVPDALQNGK